MKSTGLGIFSGPLGEQAPQLPDPDGDGPPSPPSDDLPALSSPRHPAHARRALRRLQSEPPPEFEKVIDLLYEWHEHSPAAQATDIMRKLLSQNHNQNDQQAIAAMKGLIREARKAKIHKAIDEIGLDAAEKVLGLKKDEP